MQNLQFQPGEVIVLTAGVYSDFRIAGFLVSLKQFDMGVAARAFTADPSTKKEWEKVASEDDFAGWLVAHEFAVPVSYREVHLGSYGWDDDFHIPSPADTSQQHP